MLRDLLKEKNMRYEIYLNKGGLDHFHTDNIKFFANNDVNYFEEIGVDFGNILDLEHDLFDYEVMDREDYKNSVLANSSEVITDEEFPALVISINKKVIEEITIKNINMTKK